MMSRNPVTETTRLYRLRNLLDKWPRVVRLLYQVLGRTAILFDDNIEELRVAEAEGERFAFTFQHDYLSEVLTYLLGKIHLRAPICIFTRSPWIRKALADERIHVVVYRGDELKAVITRLEEAPSRREHLVVAIDDRSRMRKTDREVFRLVVHAARRTGYKIVPVSAACRRRLCLWRGWFSWYLPFMFTRMAIRFGMPRPIPSDRGADEAQHIDDLLTHIGKEVRIMVEMERTGRRQATYRWLLLAGWVIGCAGAALFSPWWGLFGGMPVAISCLFCLLVSAETFQVPRLTQMDEDLAGHVRTLVALMESVSIWARQGNEGPQVVRILMARFDPRVLSDAVSRELESAIKQALDAGVRFRILLGEPNDQFSFRNMPPCALKERMAGGQVKLYIIRDPTHLRPHFKVFGRNHICLERTHPHLVEAPDMPERRNEVRYFAYELTRRYSRSFDDVCSDINQTREVEPC